MREIKSSDLKLCILGGGQLGKMLIEAAFKWDIQCFVLDPDPNCSCAHVAFEFTCGDFNDYNTVYQFCQKAENITIEIEHVQVDALIQLQIEGKKIFPNPSALQIIQNKGKQKLFYEDNELPTSNFQIIESKSELIELIEESKIYFPFVQKSCTAGYDGKGVQIINRKDDISQLLDGACVIEDLIEIEKEIAVIVARDAHGNISCFPSCEMEFHPTANLVEYLLAPAEISHEHYLRTQTLAKKTIEAYQITGILAVEFFLTKAGTILINEVAPRPHNSGHHTIEANYVSQFEQLLRIIFGFPLGNTNTRSKALMMNLLGEPNFTGNTIFTGLDEALNIENIYIHLYGKQITKPFRKMGHVTILADHFDQAKKKADQIKNILKVIA